MSINKTVLSPYFFLRDKYYYSKRKPYLEDLKHFFDVDTTIISSNCFAGRIYKDLGVNYMSPTIGLYFFTEDFISFVNNLEYYVNCELSFVKESKYSIGNERRQNWKHWYPIGMLDNNVEIEFLHYRSEKEAKEKWKRRCQRINFNKLYFIGSEQNLCTEDGIKEFTSLSKDNAFFFVSKKYNYPKTIFLSEFSKDDEVGDPFKKGHIYYKHMLEYLKS